jgi:hypothetical protein
MPNSKIENPKIENPKIEMQNSKIQTRLTKMHAKAPTASILIFVLFLQNCH